MIATFFVCGAFAAQRTLPRANLLDLKGNPVSSADVLNKKGLTVVLFWALWCKPCMHELGNISDVYETWQKETGVKIVAVSEDESENASRLPATVKGHGWTYDVYQDQNGDFRRACNVNNIPFLLVVTPGGRIVYSHISYVSGDEDELYKKIKEETAFLKQSSQQTGAQ